MAATLFSRPTPSGTTSFGNTTASRSGTSGRSFGNWFGWVFVVVVVVSGSVTSSSLYLLLAVALILMARGLVFSAFGSTSSSTPFWNFASTLFGSICIGTVND